MARQHADFAGRVSAVAIIFDAERTPLGTPVVKVLLIHKRHSRPLREFWKLVRRSADRLAPTLNAGFVARLEQWLVACERVEMESIVQCLTSEPLTTEAVRAAYPFNTEAEKDRNLAITDDFLKAITLIAPTIRTFLSNLLKTPEYSAGRAPLHWEFPAGAVNCDPEDSLPIEAPLAAAVREAVEEAGVVAFPHPALPPPRKHEWFHPILGTAGGRVRRKHVTYFVHLLAQRALHTEPGAPPAPITPSYDPHEVQDAKWFPLRGAELRIRDPLNSDFVEQLRAVAPLVTTPAAMGALWGLGDASPAPPGAVAASGAVSAASPGDPSSPPVGPTAAGGRIAGALRTLGDACSAYSLLVAKAAAGGALASRAAAGNPIAHVTLPEVDDMAVMMAQGEVQHALQTVHAAVRDDDKDLVLDLKSRHRDASRRLDEVLASSVDDVMNAETSAPAAGGRGRGGRGPMSEDAIRARRRELVKMSDATRAVKLAEYATGALRQLCRSAARASLRVSTDAVAQRAVDEIALRELRSLVREVFSVLAADVEVEVRLGAFGAAQQRSQVVTALRVEGGQPQQRLPGAFEPSVTPARFDSMAEAVVRGVWAEAARQQEGWEGANDNGEIADGAVAIVESTLEDIFYPLGGSDADKRGRITVLKETTTALGDPTLLARVTPPAEECLMKRPIRTLDVLVPPLPQLRSAAAGAKPRQPMDVRVAATREERLVRPMVLPDEPEVRLKQRLSVAAALGGAIWRVDMTCAAQYRRSKRDPRAPQAQTILIDRSEGVIRPHLGADTVGDVAGGVKRTYEIEIEVVGGRGFAPSGVGGEGARAQLATLLWGIASGLGHCRPHLVYPFVDPE